MISFLPVSQMDKSLYHEALEAYKPKLCEYCYGNVIAWAVVNQTQFAVFHESLYVFRYTPRNKLYFSFPAGDCTDQQLVSVIHSLSRYCAQRKEPFVLVNLTLSETKRVQALFPDRFTCDANRDGYDYLYETEPLKTYSGKKLHAKRNHYNRFIARYGSSYQYERISAENIGDCAVIDKKWRELNKGRQNSYMRAEEMAIREFLKSYDTLPLLGGLLRVNGEPCAYTVGEPSYPSSDTLVIHIEKALYEIQGAFPAIFSMFLNDNPQFIFVNREEDTGDEGLRASKLSYRPIALLEKNICEWN